MRKRTIITLERLLRIGMPNSLYRNVVGLPGTHLLPEKTWEIVCYLLHLRLRYGERDREKNKTNENEHALIAFLLSTETHRTRAMYEPCFSSLWISSSCTICLPCFCCPFSVWDGITQWEKVDPMLERWWVIPPLLLLLFFRNSLSMRKEGVDSMEHSQEDTVLGTSTLWDLQRDGSPATFDLLGGCARRSLHRASKPSWTRTK